MRSIYNYNSLSASNALFLLLSFYDELYYAIKLN